MNDIYSKATALSNKVLIPFHLVSFKINLSLWFSGCTKIIAIPVTEKVRKVSHRPILPPWLELIPQLDDAADRTIAKLWLCHCSSERWEMTHSFHCPLRNKSLPVTLSHVTMVLDIKLDAPEPLDSIGERSIQKTSLSIFRNNNLLFSTV